MRRRQIQLVVGLAALLFLDAAASAQSPAAGAAPDAPNEPVVRATVSDVTRVEAWSFFTPFASDVDPDYTLVGNRATLAVRLRSRHLDLHGAFQYAQLLGAPNDATSIGPLGPGASYYDASHAPRSYQLYIRAMSLRVKGAGLALDAGRMDFTSAAEGPARSAAVERLTDERLAGRLIGGATWTPFERAFDGIRLDVNRRRWRATSALMFPTQGAFEESANPTISALRVVTGTLAIGWPGREDSPGEFVRSSELQVFAAHYRDRRRVTGRPDNSGAAADGVDVEVGTLGVSHVGVLPGAPDSSTPSCGRRGRLAIGMGAITVRSARSRKAATNSGRRGTRTCGPDTCTRAAIAIRATDATKRSFRCCRPPCPPCSAGRSRR